MINYVTESDGLSSVESVAGTQTISRKSAYFPAGTIMYGVGLGKAPACVTSERLDPGELEEGSQGSGHISGSSTSTEHRVVRSTLADSPIDSSEI